MPRKKRKPKAQLGRPVMGDEAKKRYNVMLQPRVAERLRRIGDDNLSAGIEKAAEEYGK